MKSRLLLLVLMIYGNALDCSLPPYNCGDCVYQNNQCIQALCASKMSNLLQPTNQLSGWVQYNQQKVQVKFDLDDYELTLSSCVDIQLYRLTNKWTLPYQQILTDFNRLANTNSQMASYTFFINQKDFGNSLIAIQDQYIQQYEGYYALEFLSNNVVIARYFFQFQLILSMVEINDILYTDFFALKEMHTLQCLDDETPAEQCQLNIESQLLLCSDNSLMCISEVPLCPGQFLQNQELYLAHKITQPGFENWSLSADIIQLYDLNQGIFQQLTPISVATQINRIVYHIKIASPVQGAQIGVSSVLISPTSRRNRRVLQQGVVDKTTQASCPSDPNTPIVPQPQVQVSVQDIEDLTSTALHSADTALNQASTAINKSTQLVTSIQSVSSSIPIVNKPSNYWTQVQEIADASILAYSSTQTARDAATEAKKYVSVINNNQELINQVNAAFEKTRQAVELSYLAKTSAQTMENLIETVQLMTTANSLPMNPCGLPPINCPDCTLYNSQCFLPSCIEKIARIGSPNAGIGKISLEFQGDCSQRVSNGMVVEISYQDSETDPFELNTDGSMQTCIQAQLYRLTNNWELPYEKVPTNFQRSFAEGRRKYTFNVLYENLNKEFIQMHPQDGQNLVFDGYYVYEFQVAGKTQARYFFTVSATINQSTSSILNSDFKALKEYDSLLCPAQNSDQCVLEVNSDLNFCLDFSLNCLVEDKTTPELFLNQIFYISHKITSGGFENWSLEANKIQFYNLEQGFFQEVHPSRTNQNGNRIVYELKVNFVQSKVTLACNSILTPPATISALNTGRRILVQKAPRSTSAETGEIECIRKSINDDCPLPTVTIAEAREEQQDKKSPNFTQLLMLSLIIYCIA